MNMQGLPTIESMGGRQEFSTMGDGTHVRFARFCPETRIARTVLLPGFTEFIEKHLETIAELLDRGHEVLCVDWRGQGLSDRALSDRHRGHVLSMDLFLSDLREILRVTKFEHDRGSLKFNVVGHSMGGHLALRAAAENIASFDKIIAIAPMIDILTRHFPRGLSPWLAKAAMSLGLSGRYPPGAGGYGDKAKIFEANLLTDDPARFRRTHEFIEREPRLALGNPTFAWVNAAFASIDRLGEPSAIARINQPVLMFRAGREEIVSNLAMERFCLALPHGELVDLEQAKHEILNEIDTVRAAFWKKADGFLQD
jgi:lysophospholipase